MGRITPRLSGTPKRPCTASASEPSKSRLSKSHRLGVRFNRWLDAVLELWPWKRLWWFLRWLRRLRWRNEER